MVKILPRRTINLSENSRAKMKVPFTWWNGDVGKSFQNGVRSDKRNMEMNDRAIAKSILVGAILVSVAGGAQAAPQRLSARAEREQTKALNEQQLEQVRQQNAGLALNTQSTNPQSSATDAAAKLANNAPPVAAPTTPVQQANNLPGVDPAPGP
jgi:hypothetical protein